MLNLAIKSRPATDTRAVGAVAVVEPKSCRMRAVVRRYVTETAIVEFSGSETDDRYLLAEQLLPLIPDDAWTRSAEASPSAYIDSLEPCEDSGEIEEPGEIDGGMLRSVDAPMRTRALADMAIDVAQTFEYIDSWLSDSGVIIQSAREMLDESPDDPEVVREVQSRADGGIEDCALNAADLAELIAACQQRVDRNATVAKQFADLSAATGSMTPANDRSHNLALQKRAEEPASGQNTIDDEIRMLDSSAQRYTAYLDEAIAKNDAGIATDVANIVTGLLDRCTILQNNIDAAVDQLNEKHGVAAAIYQEFMALTERATQVAQELAVAAESEA